MKRTKKATKRKKRNAAAPHAAASKLRSQYLPHELAAMYKPIKKPVTIRVDADVLAWFQRDGRGYQTRINRALRSVMMMMMKKRK
jgi:uncharacterized protein (DUF4415 family)